MSSFKLSYTKQLTLHPSVGWSLGICGQFKGKQDLWRLTKPELIKELKQSALVQSAESSNRMEGVEMERNRLKPLLLGKARPLSRPEEEILGYRKALDWIHKNHSKIKINSETIKKLHKLAQGGWSSDAGKWKSKDNEIIEIDQKGERRVRFKCTSAKNTPAAIKNLCKSYEVAIDQQTFPDLILCANFIFDFLCIHPFRDGNGRVSRLLTLLCLYQLGYEVGSYISLERTIEESKVEYYHALEKSSKNWHHSKHDLLSWWFYFLGHIKSAYQELQDRVDMPQYGDSKTALIRQLVYELIEPFSIGDLIKLQPGLDREIIKKTLSQLKKEKVIKLKGKGRGALWYK